MIDVKTLNLLSHFASPIFPAKEVINIYRNNFRLTVSHALASIFPALNTLLGEECFNAYAALYIERNPPASPVLSTYGAAFPDFLEEQDALSNFPYLGDVGRLDLAWNNAFHSTDTEPLTPEELQQTLLKGIEILLHPSVHLVQSKQSILQIWRAARNPEDPDIQIELNNCDEFLIVARPQYEVSVSLVDGGTFAMLEAMKKSLSFYEAIEIAMAVSPDFSLEGSLSNLLVRGVFISLPLMKKE